MNYFSDFDFLVVLDLITTPYSTAYVAVSVTPTKD
jgi:hypothetical protein